MLYVSPLRYPGGKRKLAPYFTKLVLGQKTKIKTYAEPYAGGAGAGLRLLVDGTVDRLIVNDLNPGIAAFWRSILWCTDEFIQQIEQDEVSLNRWHEHRNIYLNPGNRSDIELGFSTFYLNRTNRSGILGARPIGGLDQTGAWKIDARFNRADLVKRVRKIASYASAIEVTEKPALEFISTISRRTRPVFLYVDPPYLEQGDELYLTLHSWDTHKRLARRLNSTGHPWVLTYDFDERVQELYPNNRCLRYTISHTAHDRVVDTELMIFSKEIIIEDTEITKGRTGTWIAKNLNGEERSLYLDQMTESIAD